MGTRFFAPVSPGLSGREVIGRLDAFALIERDEEPAMLEFVYGQLGFVFEKVIVELVEGGQFVAIDFAQAGEGRFGVGASRFEGGEGQIGPLLIPSTIA